MGYKKTDQCIAKAYDDERLFVLMARDPAAPKVILHWIAKSIETQPPDKLREALDCAIEMQASGPVFRGRKEADEKREAELKQREEFERWKMRQAHGEALVDAGLAMRVPTKHDGGPVVGKFGVETIPGSKYEEERNEFLLTNFANWLDAQGRNAPPVMTAAFEPHGFNKLAEEFLKSLATPGPR